MKKVFLIAAATIALAACSNDDNYTDEPVAAHISATIGKSALSRASETSWAKDDKIGVTMDDRYTNMEYTTDGSGKFTGTTMYFKNKKEPVTLTAYYPFTGTEGTAAGKVAASTNADNQTPANQVAIDFLFDKKSGILGTDPNVAFTFSHMMSKLTLIFKDGDGADVSKISAYEIGGLALDGTFNTETGKCAAKADADSPLRIDLTGVTVENGKALDPLILFPQIPGSDQVTLRIESDELDGLDNPDLIQQYSCKLPFIDGELKPGNNYVYTITVSKTKVSVDRSSIAEWVPNALEAGASSAD